jgi:hypothetical protein
MSNILQSIPRDSPILFASSIVKCLELVKLSTNNKKGYYYFSFFEKTGPHRYSDHAISYPKNRTSSIRYLGSSFNLLVRVSNKKEIREEVTALRSV